jgi:SpoVK/Ycf46/Vps4 family AAA+-type ATPase
MTDDELEPRVTSADFEHARRNVVPSVSEEEVAHYESLRVQFSAQGAALKK